MEQRGNFAAVLAAAADTGDVWPLNVGQVYTTLGRLERDGLVAMRSIQPEHLREQV